MPLILERLTATAITASGSSRGHRLHSRPGCGSGSLQIAKRIPESVCFRRSTAVTRAIDERGKLPHFGHCRARRGGLSVLALSVDRRTEFSDCLAIFGGAMELQRPATAVAAEKGDSTVVKVCRRVWAGALGLRCPAITGSGRRRLC